MYCHCSPLLQSIMNFFAVVLALFYLCDKIFSNDLRIVRYNNVTISTCGLNAFSSKPAQKKCFKWHQTMIDEQKILRNIKYGRFADIEEFPYNVLLKYLFLKKMLSTVYPTVAESGADVQLGSARITITDIIVIIAYFICIFAVGFWSSKKSKGDSVSGYFLANRSMHWIPVGASLFSSCIGSEHFIGLAGSGANSGIAVAGFDLNSIYVLLILGWIFVPVYTASGVYTMPEYLNKRFGGQRIRVYLSVLALLLYVFTKISADLFAGAIFIKQSLDLNLYLSVSILLVIAAVFTIGGGLTAVIWTDFVQTILMLIGALVLTILSLIRVGGYNELVKNFEINSQPTDSRYVSYRDDNTSCSAVTKYYMNLLRPASDLDLPWTGMTFGLTVSAVWYWCSDQVIVQRALSAKNLSHAKGGCILAAYLKILPLYLLILPGMAARVLWPNEIGCSNPVECKKFCGSESGCTNIAYPLLVLRIMPIGATGLMMSVMIAALMSSLTSIFNSASTIFTIDIYKRLRYNAGETEQVIVGRVFVVILVAISIIWIPIIEASQGSQLFHYIQSVTSYLAPPVCAVYVLAILWERVNENGAFWGLMVGLVIGMIRFVMEFSYSVPLCGSGLPDPRPAILSKVHYLHFGLILFLIVCAVTISVSLATDPIDKVYLYRLTFWTKHSENVRLDINSVVNANKPKGVDNNGFTADANQVLNSSFNFLKSIDSENTTNNNDKLKCLYTVCCMRSQLNADNTYVPSSCVSNQIGLQQTKEMEAKQSANDAKEQPFWQNVNTINAIILLVIASFLYGLYA